MAGSGEEEEESGLRRCPGIRGSASSGQNDGRGEEEYELKQEPKAFVYPHKTKENKGQTSILDK